MSRSSMNISSDKLREFYFSKATNFSTFKAKPGDASSQQSVNTTAPVKAATLDASKTLPSPVSTAASPTETVRPSPAQPPAPEAAPQTAPATVAKQPAGSAMQVARTNTSLATVTGSGDSVSPEYINFLRQQQDLVKAHQRIDQVLQTALQSAQAHWQEVEAGTSAAREVLEAAEGSTNWNWKSKFTREQLARDAGLEVPFTELRYAQDIPNVTDLHHQHQQFLKIKQTHCTGEAKEVYRLALENGVRRFEKMLKDFSRSQLDATAVTRLSDNLLVHLDHVISQPPLESVLRDVNSTIALLRDKASETKAVMDQALEDGEMGAAERETYKLIDLAEELAAAQIEQITLLTRCNEENAVNGAVREAYLRKSNDDNSALQQDTTGLKTRCEQDLARLFQLRQHVDAVEDQMRTKHAKDVETSDAALRTMKAKQMEAWAIIEEQMKRIRDLENERYLEYKQRIEAKVKDETRRVEYDQFTRVLDEHATTLDRTIHNCDTGNHCAQLMGEFISSGFNAIQKDLDARREQLNSTLVHAHRDHHDVFRLLAFTIGDLEYRKEKRSEEVAQSIQAAHIQQELCSDSLNPNAKKFSDAKKDLLKVHDALETELREIRERLRSAHEQYNPSDAALTAAGVEHLHPMTELEEWRLQLRARMVEYRAMAMGTVSSAPIRKELEQLKEKLDQSKQTIQRSLLSSPNNSRN